MNTDFATLCERARQASVTVLDNMGPIETGLSDMQGEMGKLPFFVRGFIGSEVSRGTGQDIPAWSATLTTLIAGIREAQASIDRVRAAGSVDDASRSVLLQTSERVATEQVRLAALADFMAKAPAKIGMAPAAMLPADRRAELLQTVDRQTTALRNALAAMPDLTASLDALAGEAA
jgi:hypothetical protein